MKLRSSTIIALVFTLLATTSSLLQAKLQSADVQSLRVSFADLNMGNSDDQRALYQRLQHAARSVCDGDVGRSARQAVLTKQCEEQALNEAIREIGNPGLTSISQG
jgi:UrcA family protein